MHLQIASDLIAYYLVTLVSFGVSLVVAVVVYWRNRNRPLGVIWGVATIGFALWCLGFSQYFRDIPEATAIFWAKITLTMAILNNALYLHGMTELIGVTGKHRYALVAAYLSALIFVILTWAGPMIIGLRAWTYLDHYIKYHPVLYPWLSLHITVWPLYAIGLQIYSLRRLSGYRRNQIIYFLIATVIIQVCTTLIVVPIEYNIALQPFGFFVLPFNMAFLAYVLAKGRLMEINFAIGRALLYATTIFVVMLFTFVALEIVKRVNPGFLGTPQIVFMLFMMLLISAVLAAVLPGIAPSAEQALQSRLLGDRYRYQRALSEVITQVATTSNAEELLQMVVDKIVEHMNVARAMVLMQEDATTDYTARAQASVQGKNGETPFLAEGAETIAWLRRHKRSLVKEEIQFREVQARALRIGEELDRLGVSLCVPMVLDGKLVGSLAIANKQSGDMFVDQDIKILESLCAEVALAVRYRKFEQQMIQASKLASLGTLAAGIAHEIRNPLSSIKTFVQLLPSRSNDAEFQAEFSKLVSSDVDRISKIVENVLSFARSSSIHVNEHRMEEVIEDSLSLVRSQLKKKAVEVTTHYQDLPPVKVDKDQMSQVFVNIILNAVDALPDLGGKIRVSCQVASVASPKDPRRRTMPHLLIEIADNGQGIPDNIKGKLFDPFFTTKSHGTGLGLSITHQIVESHGGFIQVRSAAGQGAAFLINLPL